jgi:hypothetical protein
MSKLRDMIKEERQRRAAGEVTDDDILVVIIRRFSSFDVPSAILGNTVIEQNPEEVFSRFEARAVSAARSAATPCVAVEVPDGSCRKRSEQVDRFTTDRAFWDVTGAEFVALANHGVPLSSVSN